MTKKEVTEEELRKQRNELIEENERLQSDKKFLQDIQEIIQSQERKQKSIFENDEKLFAGSKYEYFIQAVDNSIKQDERKLKTNITESFNNTLQKIKKNENKYLQNEKALNNVSEDEE